jgi:hypothetical protein
MDSVVQNLQVNRLRKETQEIKEQDILAEQSAVHCGHSAVWCFHETAGSNKLSPPPTFSWNDVSNT